MGAFDSAYEYMLATAVTGPCGKCGKDSEGFSEYSDNIPDERGLITVYAQCFDCWEIEQAAKDAEKQRLEDIQLLHGNESDATWFKDKDT